MNKGLQIFLLILLFAIGFGGGYVIEDMLLGNKEESLTKPTPIPDPYDQPGDESDEAKSTVPVIDGKTTPKRSANNTYSFTAKATVESGDNLMYELYSDASCTNLIDENRSGEFSNIPSSSNGKYYLCVVNLNTNDVSEVCEISGFVYVQMFTKLESHEIENVVNNIKIWSDVPADFKNRVANPIKITVSNLRSDENPVSNLADACRKVNMGTWNSITVTNKAYDSQGRLNALTISVNY